MLYKNLILTIMRKLFVFITIIFIAEFVSGQTPTLQQPAATGGYVNPNPGAYGTVSQSIMIWKQFGIPTGNGAPSGTQKADLHLSLLYFDSTNNVLYNYSPSTHEWVVASSNPYPITFAYNSSNDSLVLTLSDGTRFPVTITGTPITDDSTQINYNWTGDTITRVPYAYQLDSAFGLVSATPNPDGAFATRANYVFQRIGADTTFSDYQFFYPDTANTFYDKSQEIVYTWTGAAWVPSPKSWLDILNRDKKALNGGTYFYYDVILKTNHVQRIRIGKDGRVWIYNLAHDGDDSSWTIGVTKAGLLYAKELKDLVLTHDGDCATGATLVGDTLNIPICSGGGGGGGGSDSLFGIKDNLGLQDRGMDMEGFEFGLFNAKDAFLESDNGSKYAVVGSDATGSETFAQLSAANSGSDYSNFSTYWNRFVYSNNNTTGSHVFTITSPLPSNGDYYIPLSVNGNYADSTGNITISTGGGSGITSLGTPTYGLTRTNDSTYEVDTSLILTKLGAAATYQLLGNYLLATDTAAMLSPYVRTIVAGTGTTVDNTNPQYPVVSSSGGSGSTNVYAPLIKSGDTLSQRYNVLHYGATADGKFDSTISISSSSTTLTSTRSVFSAGDVGKIIVVVGAGTSGRDLVTTISAYTSATQITLTASAGTTVSAADCIWGTDQTAAIQAAINAAWFGGGGKVIIPNGIYIIAGALQTNVNGLNMNSQLYIPAPAQWLNDSVTHIEIVGESRPNYTQIGAFLNFNFNTYKGTTLISTLTTGATGAAIIGTAGQTGFIDYNYNYLTVRNLALKVLDNPNGSGAIIGGISYKKGASLFTDNVMICHIGKGVGSVAPTNEVSGIETPDVSSESMTHLSNTAAAGFRNGFMVGEHSLLDQCEAFVCFRGFNYKAPAHSSLATRILSHWCTNDIYVSGAATTFFKIELLDIEYMDATFSGGAWYDNAYTINDSLKHGAGKIVYDITRVNVGRDNAHFIANGGTWANGGYIDAVCDSTQGMYALHTSVANNGIEVYTAIKNSSNTGKASLYAINDAGTIGGINVLGSSFATTGLKNYTALVADSAIALLANAKVASGGTKPIDFITSGSSGTAMARFNSSGNALYTGKVAIGTGGLTLTPLGYLHVKYGGGAGGIALEATSSSQYASIDFYNNSSSLVGQFLNTNSGFSSGMYLGNSTYLTNFNTSGIVGLIAAGSSGYLSFGTGGSATGNERMRIFANGNIGVGSTTDNSNGKLQITGNLALETAGNKLLIATGTNAAAGTGTLSSGTVTITTSAVTASSLIILTYNGGSVGTVPALGVSSKTAGTGFTVVSSNASDSGTFSWTIIN